MYLCVFGPFVYVKRRHTFIHCNARSFVCSCVFGALDLPPNHSFYLDVVVFVLFGIFFRRCFSSFITVFFLLHACDYVYLNAKFIQKYKKTNRSIATCPVSVNWWINAGYFFLVALLYSIEKRKRRNISIAKTVQWKFNQRVLNVNANHPH